MLHISRQALTFGASPDEGLQLRGASVTHCECMTHDQFRVVSIQRTVTRSTGRGFAGSGLSEMR